MINKFLYFFNKNQKRTLLILFALMFISSILEMVGLGFIFSIVGALSPENMEKNFILDKLSNFIDLNNSKIFLNLLLVFFLFYIFKTIFLIFFYWFKSNFTYSYQENLSSKVFRQYLNQKFSYFFNRNSSELIRNILTEIDQFLVFLGSLLELILEVIVIIGIFCLLSFIDFYFTLLITTVFILLASLYFLAFRGRLNTWGQQRQIFMKKKIQFMQEGFDGLKIIKLLGRENFFYQKFKFHNVNLSKIATLTTFFQSVPRLLLEIVGIIFITLSLYTFYSSGKNLVEITQILSVYVAASFRILPSVNRIVSNLQFMKLSYPALKVLYKELNSFSKEEDIAHEKFQFKKNISINIQNFTYPNSQNFEISNVKIDIQKGQKIGIMGASGSGKSTIMEILTGVLELEKGDVLVDEKSVFKNIRGWQKLIGFVPQKIFILDESLRNNILFGLDNKKFTDNQILELIKKINLEKLLNRLPGGLDGNLGEEGLNLSGGEIQRIGMCRALIYDPEILFLDEATSALDNNTESQILDELKLFKEKTIISIAHRLNTLKYSDMIYYIENGKLLDQGNFEKFKLIEKR